MLKSLILLICVGVSYCQSTTQCSFKIREAEFSKYCVLTGSRLYVGDFDGNKYDDLMCHNTETGDVSIFFSTVPIFRRNLWSGPKTCRGAKYVVLGDFNGDYRTDLLCQYPTGEKYIYFATKMGTFPSTYVTVKAKTSSTPSIQTWCTQSGYRPVVGDFDGDGTDDYLCYDGTSGFMWVIYGQSTTWGTFRPEYTFKETFRCRGEVLTAQFNGDLKTNLVCYSKGDGKIKIASFDETQVKVIYDSTLKCTGDHIRVMLADVDGDRYDDLFCKLPGKTPLVFRNTRNGNFYEPVEIDFQPKVEKDKSFRTIEVGDFNGDGKSDVMCHGFDGSLQLAESFCLRM